jgi:hypothetical protein
VGASYLGSTTTIGTSGNTTVVYTGKLFDTNGAYASGEYTIPETGYYHLSASIAFVNNVTNAVALRRLYLYRNTTLVASGTADAFSTPSGEYMAIAASASFSANAGDTVVVQAGFSTAITLDGSQGNYFSIFQIH